MAPPPGYNAASVWHKDFPPRELIDNTTDPETGESVEWRKRGKVRTSSAERFCVPALIKKFCIEIMCCCDCC